MKKTFNFGLMLHLAGFLAIGGSLSCATEFQFVDSDVLVSVHNVKPALEKPLGAAAAAPNSNLEASAIKPINATSSSKPAKNNKKFDVKLWLRENARQAAGGSVVVAAIFGTSIFLAKQNIFVSKEEKAKSFLAEHQKSLNNINEDTKAGMQRCKALLSYDFTQIDDLSKRSRLETKSRTLLSNILNNALARFHDFKELDDFKKPEWLEENLFKKAKQGRAKALMNRKLTDMKKISDFSAANEAELKALPHGLGDTIVKALFDDYKIKLAKTELSELVKEPKDMDFNTLQTTVTKLVAQTLPVQLKGCPKEKEWVKHRLGLIQSLVVLQFTHIMNAAGQVNRCALLNQMTVLEALQKSPDEAFSCKDKQLIQAAKQFVEGVENIRVIALEDVENYFNERFNPQTAGDIVDLIHMWEDFLISSQGILNYCIIGPTVKDKHLLELKKALLAAEVDVTALNAEDLSKIHKILTQANKEKWIAALFKSDSAEAPEVTKKLHDDLHNLNTKIATLDVGAMPRAPRR